MKIHKKYRLEAIEKLKAVNGKRRERIVTISQLEDLFETMEKVYKENTNKKYFRGVEGSILGTRYSKPNAYKYRATITTIYAKIEKGKKPEIKIQAEPWGYIPDYRLYKTQVLWY